MVTSAAPTLTLEQTRNIENRLYDQGYLGRAYVQPARAVQTDIPCPICGTNFIIYAAGNSYHLNCETDSCVVVTARGL